MRCSDHLVIPRDGLTALRLAAALRFEQAARGRRHGRDRSAMPTFYQRLRFVRLLSICDAVAAGASAREVAYEIVLRNRPLFSSADWKGSGERRHVVRLIAEARRLVNRGYLKILRHK
jgi:hypothetical protein